jgi:hypothetical protein
MRIFLFIVALLFSASAFGQAIQRSPWTTNVNGTTIPDGSVTRLTEVGTKTNQVDGGGASGRFLSENLAGALSGIFTDRYRYTGGNIVASNWLALPGSGAYDFSIGLNVMDPDEELMHPVWSYTNLSSDATFRFWKPVAMPNLASNATVVNGLGQDANGVLMKTAPPIQMLPMFNSDMVIDDFSQYATTASTPTINGGYGFDNNGVVTTTAEIGPRTMLDGHTRNVLRIMGKGDYVRPLPWGTNWTRMRVGIIFAVTNSGATFTNAFGVGICANGTNGGFFGTSCSNNWMIGTAAQASTEHSFFFSNQLDVAFYRLPFLDRSSIRTNNTTAVTTSGSGSMGRAIGAIPHFTVMYVDFARIMSSTWPTTNQTFTVTTRAMDEIVAASGGIITKRAGINSFLLDLNELSSTYVLADSDTVTYSAITHNERFWGPYNSVTISWGRSDLMLEVWAVAVAKLH